MELEQGRVTGGERLNSQTLLTRVVVQKALVVGHQSHQYGVRDGSGGGLNRVLVLQPDRPADCVNVQHHDHLPKLEDQS